MGMGMGMKLTKNQRAIIEYLQTQTRPLAKNEVMVALPEISKPTVYRLLNEMTKQGLLIQTTVDIQHVYAINPDNGALALQLLIPTNPNEPRPPEGKEHYLPMKTVKGKTVWLSPRRLDPEWNYPVHEDGVYTFWAYEDDTDYSLPMDQWKRVIKAMDEEERQMQLKALKAEASTDINDALAPKEWRKYYGMKD